MSNQQIIAILKAFQRASAKSALRWKYLDMFKKRMAYRTTKTENPEVTYKLVDSVLSKPARKHND